MSEHDQQLKRFLEAQNEGSTYEHALSELQAARKRSHWMWFVFPQIAGLGNSHMSVRYAISSLEEARAFIAHPVLGRRLLECAEALMACPSMSASEILGGVDAIKLRSSMTLFARAVPDEPLFERVLERYFDGESDEATERRL